VTPFPLVILIKATLLLAAAALVDVLLRRRGSAATRHLVWTIAIVGLLALPIASISLPQWTVRIPVVRPDAAAVVVNAVSIPIARVAVSSEGLSRVTEVVSHGNGRIDPQPALSWFLLITALYAAGVSLLLGRLAIEPFVLRRLARAACEVTDPEWTETIDQASVQLQITRRVRLLRTAREIMPLTFGTLAPVILLPASSDDWPPDRQRAVLLHELAHIARHDCLVQRLAAVACALYWPHPGVWWAARRLRVERELACDDRVLASGAGAREYAGHLLELAHSLGSAPAPATALGMARPKQLESRLLAVLDVARNRTAIHPRGRTLALAIAIVVLIPLAAVHAALVAPDAALMAFPTPMSVQSQSGAPALQDLTGSWELRLSREPGMAQVTIRTEHGNHSRSIRIDQLPGISVEQISAASTTIRLPIRREAGTFNVDGVCHNGVCGGTFAFEPSQAFAAELAKRGLERPTPRQQMELALADVGVAYLDALEKAGYAKPDLAQVVRAAQHGVDAGYLREMTSLGYRAGTLEALIRLRDHGVDPDYVKGMRESGYRVDSPEELVRLRDHGIDPEYVRGMATSGFPKLTIDQLLDARNHGIDPEYISGLASLGYKNLSLDDLLQARNHGVDPSYIREMSELGYKNQSVDALIKMRNHGVDPQYVKEMAELGYKSLPADDMIRLRDHGVDATYIRRVQQKGLGHLSVDELIYRRDRGMDDPDAAARAVAAQVQSLWQSVVRWLRS
jgi:beta-lactamase regulating signal transducer with metallopeptidase domain